MGTRPNQRIGILAMSVIADDPRVRRQGEAFYLNGWDVLAVGLPGNARSPPPTWPIVHVENYKAFFQSASDRNDRMMDNAFALHNKSSVYRTVLQSRLHHPLQTNRRLCTPSSEPSAYPEAVRVDTDHQSAVALPIAADTGSAQASSPSPSIASSQSHLTPIVTPIARRLLKAILPLAVRDILRPYSTWSGVKYKTRVFQSRASKRLRDFVSVGKSVFPFAVGPSRFALRTYVAFVSRISIQRRHLRHLAKLVLIRISPQQADQVYWSLNGAFSDMYKVAAQYRPSIWLANDWTMLPLALRLSRNQGVPFGYDTHEFATSEYGHKLKWRLLYKPIIRALEQQSIPRASIVSCVSTGISSKLYELYRLPNRPLVIRNVPRYEKCSFRKTNNMRILYHGIIVEGRGLEQCIASVPHWDKGQCLYIRGPVSAPYRDKLQALIEEHKVSSRVHLLPPVPMVDLVKSASEFDIGIFILPAVNAHNSLVLPNKIFEYIMAGLALCVSRLSEIVDIVERFDVGLSVSHMDPVEIAHVVNSLDHAEVDRFKKNALEAAKTLNWDIKFKLLVSAYDRVL